MRTLLFIPFYFFVLSKLWSVNPSERFPAHAEKSLFAEDESIFSQLTVEEMATLKKKEIRAKIGRKLTIREWLGIKVLKSQVRKDVKNRIQSDKIDGRPYNAVSITAAACSLIGIILASFLSVSALWAVLTFGIAGFVLGIMSFFFPKNGKKRRGDGFAFFGIVLGIGTILGGILLIWAEHID